MDTNRHLINESVNGYKFHLPTNVTINSKTYVTSFKIDKSKKIDVVFCPENPQIINTTECCVIENSDTLKYFRKVTFSLDTFGVVQNLREYHTEGYIWYTRNDMLKDSSGLSSWKINLLKPNAIRIDADNNSIIDNGDTLKIIDHWPNQKFIFVVATNLDTSNFDKEFPGYKIVYSYK